MMRALRVIDGGKTPKVKVWMDTKEDFIVTLSTRDRDYIISDTNQLWDVKDEGFMEEEGQKVVHRFTISSLSWTVDKLRQYCAEFHPEVDFDAEFEPQRRGISKRWAQKFGYREHEQWLVYQELEKAIRARGYQLPF